VKEGQTDFLDEFEAQDTASPEPRSEPSKDVSRDEQGRFAPKAEQQAEQVQQGVKPEPAQAVSEPEPPSEPEGSHVPVSALKAERMKRQALEAELAKYKQPNAQPQVQPQQPTPKSPEFAPPQVDWEEDPQHYVQAQIHSMRMEQSKFFAVSQSSEREVAEAWNAFDAACNTDPALSAYSETLINHPHPMGEVLKWHRKQQQLSQLEEAGGLDKYRERIIAEYLVSQGQQTAPVSAAPQRQQQPKPMVPPSLANGGIGAAASSEPASEDLDLEGFFAEARKPRKR
jgi:hypothetical protein